MHIYIYIYIQTHLHFHLIVWSVETLFRITFTRIDSFSSTREIKNGATRKRRGSKRAKGLGPWPVIDRAPRFSTQIVVIETWWGRGRYPIMVCDFLGETTRRGFIVAIGPRLDLSNPSITGPGPMDSHFNDSCVTRCADLVFAEDNLTARFGRWCY